mgnify:CR=1 FL=1
MLHRLSPGLKLGATLAVVVAVVLMPRRPDGVYLLPAALLLGLWPLARLPLSFALRRMIVAEFFILGMALLTLLAPDAMPIFLAALIKSNLSIFAMVLLIWTTPFQSLLQQLRRMGLPGVMVTTLALMYRYLPVLAEESNRMQRARAGRTFSPARRLAWHTLTLIIGQLFVRAADRAERIYLAMCARGWR